MSTAQVSIYIKRNQHKEYFQVRPLLRAGGVAALKLPAYGELSEAWEALYLPSLYRIS